MASNSYSTEWLRLREIIREKSLRRDREYVLSSGARSNYYFDMKPTTFDPEALNLIAHLLYARIAERPGIYMGGLAIGAVPIISALVFFSATQRNPLMGFCVREEIKNHGSQRLIEGFLENGAEVIVFDDVTTTGDSAMKAVDAVKERSCKVLKVVTIVDRLEGATETFNKANIPFEALFTTKDFDG